MSGMFLSYRRDDSAGYAGRLGNDLREHFGPDRVFMDIETIEPGLDFVEAIDKAAESCDVLLVVIGRQWLAAVDAKGQRRLDDPNDYVRVEISTALKRKIRVIPILLQNASMPSPEDLPEDLVFLTRRHAIEVADTRWKYDIQRLIETLEKVLGVPHKGQAKPSLDSSPPPLARLYRVRDDITANHSLSQRKLNTIRMT